MNGILERITVLMGDIKLSIAILTRSRSEMLRGVLQSIASQKVD